VTVQQLIMSTIIYGWVFDKNGGSHSTVKQKHLGMHSNAK